MPIRDWNKDGKKDVGDYLIEYYLLYDDEEDNNTSNYSFKGRNKTVTNTERKLITPHKMFTGDNKLSDGIIVFSVGLYFSFLALCIMDYLDVDSYFFQIYFAALIICCIISTCMLNVWNKYEALINNRICSEYGRNETDEEKNKREKDDAKTVSDMLFCSIIVVLHFVAIVCYAAIML